MILLPEVLPLHNALAPAFTRTTFRRFLILAGDDTVDGHAGRKVYGKARHRDPVRSCHGFTAWR